MMVLAQAIGLSYDDIVDITAWSLTLVSLGVFFGKVIYDIYNSFGDFCGLLLGRLLAFMAKRFPNVRKKTKKSPLGGFRGD